jgi:hypothetical protein
MGKRFGFFKSKKHDHTDDFGYDVDREVRESDVERRQREMREDATARIEAAQVEIERHRSRADDLGIDGYVFGGDKWDIGVYSLRTAAPYCESVEGYLSQSILKNNACVDYAVADGSIPSSEVFGSLSEIAKVCEGHMAKASDLSRRICRSSGDLAVELEEHVQTFKSIREDAIAAMGALIVRYPNVARSERPQLARRTQQTQRVQGRSN